ncbi:hypothetical protein GCM10023185_09400 [Hymenobacter saemangeumensis]|uniref:Cyclase n=1 Tax=Hymenobacter saemangeumensis TaxID=1084522 RepID=A0ABP8I4B6_9BACT
MANPIHTHLSHEVEDFATWKQGFDAHEPYRQKHGIRIHGVYQAHDNPNHVTVHGEVDDASALQSFMADPDVQATMQTAGVKGRPDMKMMHKHA